MISDHPYREQFLQPGLGRCAYIPSEDPAYYCGRPVDDHASSIGPVQETDPDNACEDMRSYLIECSNALSEIEQLIAQQVLLSKAILIRLGGNPAEENLMECSRCAWPISTNRTLCGDCQLAAHMESNREKDSAPR